MLSEKLLYIFHVSHTSNRQNTCKKTNLKNKKIFKHSDFINMYQN